MVPNTGCTKVRSPELGSNLLYVHPRKLGWKWSSRDSTRHPHMGCRPPKHGLTLCQTPTSTWLAMCLLFSLMLSLFKENCILARRCSALLVHSQRVCSKSELEAETWLNQVSHMHGRNRDTGFIPCFLPGSEVNETSL